MMGNAIAAGLLVVLVVIGIAVPFLLILNAWMVEQTLNPGLALSALAALLILPFAIWQTQGTIWMFLCIAVVTGGCAALPFLHTQVDKRARSHMRDEDIAKYRRAIQFDPKNAAAHGFLADAYMESGLYDEAIAEYETAIELDPHSSHKERWKLRKAIEAKQGLTRPRIIVCDECQGETPVGNKVCAHCGAMLSMSFFEWLAQPDTIKTVAKQSVIALLVVTILLAIFSALPLEWKGCIICASAIVGGFYLLRGIGG